MNEPEQIFDAYHLAAPQRTQLGHAPPPHASSGPTFFITINCEQRGKNHLCGVETAKTLIDAVRFYHEAHKWFAALFLVMPDHVHGLFAFPVEENLQQVVSNWKRYTARSAKIKWQRDFFDHRLRHDESCAQKAEYIRQNPVRKSLVSRPEDWPHVLENSRW